MQARRCRSKSYFVVVAPDGSTLRSKAAAWKHFLSAAPFRRAPPPNGNHPSPPASPYRSPGMRQFLASVPPATPLYSLRSRADVLLASPCSLGPSTEVLRDEAVRSVFSNPIVPPRYPCPPSDAVPPRSAGDDVRTKARAAAIALLPLLPEACFISMAGGAEAYAATPLAERQQANLRTLCKAVGRNGDAGLRLATLISKLAEYRRLRGVPGDMWPLYPCILSNFAVWLQVNSPKDGATSVAPRCISAFVSAASSLSLPVVVDSPHLGSVPAHQASGDGYTGFVPLDVVHELCAVARGTQSCSAGLLFDSRAAYTMWEGSCRTQDWVEVSPAAHELAPGASAVYKIGVTKNGEKGALFAVGRCGVEGLIDWREEFNAQLRRYGSTPALSCSDYNAPSCAPVHGTKVDSKCFASRIFNVILHSARRRGYTRQQLKDLHVTTHSLHGSMAAYAEALEWDYVPTHRLGRWRLPAGPAAPIPARKRMGAGRAGAKSIPAVYSTAASCQVQLALRSRLIDAIRTVGSDFSTHGDMSCFITNPRLASGGFRGPHGHEPHPTAT